MLFRSKFERDIAGNLSDVISDTLGLKNRGVKTEIESHHGKLGWMRLNCENVLIEVCFITNTHDIKNYQTYKSILSENIASQLSKFAKT